jgi:hypothetical protein
MTSTPIDVWNLETFDEALLAELNARRDLLRDYEFTSKRNFLEQQAAKEWVPLKSNTYAAERNYVVEQVIVPAMEQRTIRAWHYTRLTDDETALLESGGSYISDLAGIRRRLDAQVAASVLSAGSGQKVRHTFHKPARRPDGGTGAFNRHARSGAGFIVGNSFEIVGAAKKRPQFHVEARIAFGQSPKLILHALMALGDLAGSLEDKGLRRMQPCQIRRAACFVGPVVVKHPSSLDKKLARLLHKSGALRLHRSMPPRRISCINGVRSS